MFTNLSIRDRLETLERADVIAIERQFESWEGSYLFKRGSVSSLLPWTKGLKYWESQMKYFMTIGLSLKLGESVNHTFR